MIPHGPSCFKFPHVHAKINLDVVSNTDFVIKLIFNAFKPCSSLEKGGGGNIPWNV